MSRVLFRICAWQNSAKPWIYLIFVCALLIIIAHYFFQEYLFMAPCEQCVYIRLAFFVILLGAILGTICGGNLLLKFCAYGVCFVGALYGIARSIYLYKVHSAILDKLPFGVHGCSFKPNFPLNLPLDEWFPSLFKPTGDCGLDAPIVPLGTSLDPIQSFFVDLYSNGWYLIPSAKFGTMAECMILAFGVILAVLFVMMSAQIYAMFSKKI